MNEEYTPIPIDEPTTIQVAYSELSKSAFSVWIRLLVASDEEMVGWDNVSEAVSLSVPRAKVVLTELIRKGFLNSERKGRGGKSHFEIRRRAVLSGQNKFIRLSSFYTLLNESKDTKCTDENLSNLRHILNPQIREKHLKFSPNSLANTFAQLTKEKPDVLKTVKAGNKSNALTSIRPKINIKLLRKPLPKDKLVQTVNDVFS